MTDARLEDVPVDLSLARRYVATASRMLGDAAAEALSDEAQYTLLYDAARNAITAALRAHGKRVTAGSRAHVVTITAAKALLAAEHAPDLDRIDRVRRVRHQIEYDTREVSSVEVEAIREPARRIVNAARDVVDAASADHGA
jgi:hypothetical protein